MLDDIWSITTGEGRWWISEAEYERLERFLVDGAPLDANDFVSVKRLDGGEVIVRVGAIDSLEHSTAAQRAERRQNVALYEMEEPQ